MSKKTKNLLLLVLAVVVVVFGISRLRIQSVSDYQKESEGLSKQLQLEEETSVELPDIAVSGTSTNPVKETSESSFSAAPQKEKKVRPKHTARVKTDTDKKSTESRKDSAAAVQESKHTKNEKKNRPKATPDVTKKPAATPSGQKPDTISCTIEIRCDSLNENRDILEPSLLEYVPEDGILLTRTRVTAAKKSSVYDVLSQVCHAKKIALDAEYTPMYGSYYVRGIGHLYEMDAGDMSGWLYTVNGKKPDVGASSFILSEGDAIVRGYSCNGTTM